MNEQVRRQAAEVLEGRLPPDARVVAAATIESARKAFFEASTLATKGTEGWKQAVLSNCAGAKEIGDKCLENTAANVEAAFEAARSIAASKTFPEVSAAYTNFVQSQFAATAAQTAELYKLSANIFRRGVEGIQIKE